MNRSLRNGVLGVGIILLLASLYLVFIWVPTEKVMGIVQRIFYLMVPMGWLAMLSFAIIFVASIRYLASRNEKWDNLGYCAAEMGVIFTTLTLITGSLWARPVWGVWWTWEPRLTATLVLWLIYLAYFMVRSFAREESQGSRFSAVVGIIGFVDIPIIGMSTSLWRGMHPGILVAGGLETSMLVTLIVSILAFTALYLVVLSERVSLRQGEREVRRLRRQLEEK